MMNIQNRMDDVVRLRCHVCQEFMKMIAQPGWQRELYALAETAIKYNLSFKEKYLPAYKKMRMDGIDEYTVDDMDVTIITAIVIYSNNSKIISIPCKDTKDALQRIAYDRNITGHSNANEDAVDLYLRALLSLGTIKSFVEIVDLKELSIDNAIRQKYLKDNTLKINTLTKTIDEERIALIQIRKEIDCDIQRIKESEDPEKIWLEIYEAYDKRRRIEGNRHRMDEFIYRASDAGIIFAHEFAVYSAGLNKDWEEYDKRLMLVYDSINKNEDISKINMQSILSGINVYIFDHSESDTIRKILDDLQSRGYIIQKNPRGFYQHLEGPK